MFRPLPRPLALRTLLLALTSAYLAVCPAALAAKLLLVDFGKLGVESQITINGSAEVATQIVDDPRGKALEVRCTPGANPAPGVVIRPGEVMNWNLAAYGEVEADVTNLSDAPLVINLRVNNPGAGKKAKGNTDKLALPVGKSGTVRVYFGYTMGEQAYALAPDKVSQIVIFTGNPAKRNATFRVTSLRAVGKPGDKPVGAGTAITATKPGPDGVVVPLDGSLTAAQTETHGAKLVLPSANKPGPAVISIEAGANQKPSVSFKVAPGTGLDLAGYGQVEFALKNPGPLSIHVYCRVENAPGADNKPVVAFTDATLEPGAAKTILVPLASKDGFSSAKVTAFAVAVEQDGKSKKLELTTVKAVPVDSAAPPLAATPPPSPSASREPAAPTPAKMAPPTPSASASPSASPTKAAVSPTPSSSSSPPASPSASPKKTDGPSGTQRA